MRRSEIAKFFLLLSLLYAARVPAQASESMSFSAIDVPGATATIINGINRPVTFPHSLEMVGSYSDLSGSHGFLYSGGTFTQLDAPTPNQPYPHVTVAYGINGRHQIVGSYNDPSNGGWKGFLYYGGRYTALKQCSLPDFHDFEPHGINNAGIYVGTQLGGSSTDNLFHDWGFVQGAHLSCAPVSVPAATQTEIYGVNSSELSAGSYTDVRGKQHGATFLSGAVVNTFDCYGADTATVARGVNDSGVVVGYCDAFRREGRFEMTRSRHGFVYAQGALSLIDVPGASRTEVHGISSADPVTGSYDVVGSYDNGDGLSHGFIAAISPINTQPAGERRSGRG